MAEVAGLHLPNLGFTVSVSFRYSCMDRIFLWYRIQDTVAVYMLGV